MRFEELNWMDVENYLKNDTRVILVIGATEQHGYLSLLTDIKIPLALADAASTETGVLVAPPLNFGSSPYFLHYPGTISLSISTLVCVMNDILTSLYTAGFRKVLVLNGHGGNSGAKAVLSEFLNSHPDCQMNWYEWWNSHSVEEICVKHEIKPAHANWLEAFSFTTVSEMPDEFKTPPAIPGLMDAKTARVVYGDGSFGGFYKVSDKIMGEIFEATLKDILQLLQF